MTTEAPPHLASSHELAARRAATIPDGHTMLVSFRALEEMRQHRFWSGFVVGFVVAAAAVVSVAWIAVQSVGGP